VILEFDPVSVKDFMGHANVTTTERYLHARSRRTDAARMTKAFAGDAVVLSVEREGQRQTVRVYDGAHGVNELHRHTAAGRSKLARCFTPVALAKACARQSRSA
jgi:hypothetical protein